MENKRLLILEDDPDVAALLMKSARDQGYEVLVGKSNGDFEELVTRWHPTVVALDILMPGRDGLELLQALTSLNFDGAVIVVTGAGGLYLRAAQSVAERRHLRIAGVLEKPFRLFEFHDLLSTVATSDAR